MMYDEAKIITPKAQNRRIPNRTTTVKNTVTTDSVLDHSSNPKWVIDQSGVEKQHSRK